MNLIRQPTNRPLMPCYCQTSLMACLWVLAQLAFYKWVLIASKGMMTRVPVSATKNEPASKYLFGIFSVRSRSSLFLRIVFMIWSISIQRTHATDCLRSNGVKPLNSSLRTGW